jgi:hypothetical protein
MVAESAAALKPDQPKYLVGAFCALRRVVCVCEKLISFK